MNTHKESNLQTKVCKWLRKEYPGILFISDFAAGLYFKEDWIKTLRANQACDDKYLDLTIMRPKGPMCAIIIEIKCLDTDLFLKDGTTLKNEHVQLQYNTILKLRGLGYYADFGVGFEDCINIIRDYMNGFFKYKVIEPFRGTMTIQKSDKLADEFFSEHGIF